MGLFDGLVSFIKKQTVKAQKDDVLFVAIHRILTGELGWKVKSFKMEGDVHEASYYHPSSPIHELEVEAERRGSTFVLKMEAETLKGEVMEDFLESIFGIDVDFDEEIMVKFDLDRYITDDLELINAEELRDHIVRFVRELERRIASRR